MDKILNMLPFASKKDYNKKVVIPIKRTINLATVGEQTINKKIATPAIVIIILLAVLFSKFAVYDRIMNVYNMQSEINQIQSEIDLITKKINTYSNITDEYEHYTYSGFTKEELSLVDRGDIIQLIDKHIVSSATVESWNLKDNQLTVVINGASLGKVNSIVSNLEDEDIVSYCSVHTATTESTSVNVIAEITIYLENGGNEE